MSLLRKEQICMGWWPRFLDSLATTGGHVFSLQYLITFGTLVAVGGAAFHIDVAIKIGETVATGSFGALLMMYKASGTNAEQAARAGAPYQPPQPPVTALTPALVVGDPPLPITVPALEPLVKTTKLSVTI